MEQEEENIRKGGQTVTKEDNLGAQQYKREVKTEQQQHYQKVLFDTHTLLFLYLLSFGVPLSEHWKFGGIFNPHLHRCCGLSQPTRRAEEESTEALKKRRRQECEC